MIQKKHQDYRRNKMFIVLEIILPTVNVLIDPDGFGRALIFDTKKDAKKYAEENCAWQYKIVEV